MNRKDKSLKIGSILDKLYPETPVPLDHLNSYTLLVAVMLSAQTTDKKVNEVTPELFKLADSPEKMVKLKEEHIKEIISRINLKIVSESSKLELKINWIINVINRRQKPISQIL